MKKEIPWILIIQKLKHDLTVWLAEDNHRVIFKGAGKCW